MDYSQQVETITQLLLEVSHTQHLIDEASEGYICNYQNEEQDSSQSEYFRYKPDEVELHLSRQTLYFRSGPFAGPHSDYPSIATAMRMFVRKKYLGVYYLFSLLNGMINDDVILIYAEEPITRLSERSDWPAYPVDELETVPENMRSIFPLLNQIVEEQKLEQMAVQRCADWFALHPDWDQNYPQSLVDSRNPQEQWFKENPDWFKKYPRRPFPPKRHKVTFGFDRMHFCFNHGQYPQSHFLTRVKVFEHDLM